MTSVTLTNLVAERVMGWSVGPDRFMMGNRRWIPAWRFQPTERIEDAFRVLDAADPDEYRIDSCRGGSFTVKVRIAGGVGEASEMEKARAITHAVARAIGLEPEGGNEQRFRTERP